MKTIRPFHPCFTFPLGTVGYFQWNSLILLSLDTVGEDMVKGSPILAIIQIRSHFSENAFAPFLSLNSRTRLTPRNKAKQGARKEMTSAPYYTSVHKISLQCQHNILFFTVTAENYYNYSPTNDFYSESLWKELLEQDFLPCTVWVALTGDTVSPGPVIGRCCKR